MKKAGKFVILLICICFVSSCDGRNAAFFEDITSYVAYYIPFDSIRVYRTDAQNQVDIYCIPEMLVPTQHNTLSYRSTGEDFENYKKLCQKHKDLNYSGKIRYVSSYCCPEPLNCYFNIDFDSIIVQTDTIYDEKHNAGSTLNDVVWICANTPIPFFENNYQSYNYKINNEKLSYYFKSRNLSLWVSDYPVDCWLSDVDSKQLQLLFGGTCHPISLFFPTKQSNFDLSHISIKLYADDGRIFEINLKQAFYL